MIWRIGVAPSIPPTATTSATSSSDESEQLVADWVVRAGGKAAFQQGRNDVECAQRDHQPDRGARESIRRDGGLVVSELAVDREHRGERDDGNGEADERPRVVVIAEQCRAVAGIAGHD